MSMRTGGERISQAVWIVGALIALALTTLPVHALRADEATNNAVLLQVDRQIKEGDYAGALSTIERGEGMVKPGDSPEFAVSLYVRFALASLAVDKYDEARRKLFDGIELLKDYEGSISTEFEFAVRDMILEIAKQGREYEHGNRAAKEAINARLRAYGKQHTETASARMNAARWYLFSSQFSRAAKECERVIKILEAEFGENSEHLQEPLLLLVNSHMAGNRKPKEIRRALERILTLEFSRPKEGQLVKSEAFARLGDMQVIFYDSVDSSEHYRQAWHARKEYLGGDTEATNRSFAETRRLRYVMPSAPGRSDRGAEYFGEGYVVTEFTVAADGTVTDATIYDSKPGNDFDLTAVRAIRKAKFRPRIVDGEPVDTSGVQFRQTYSYQN